MVVKNPAARAGDSGSIPGWEDLLEKGTATHSSNFAWETPWTEELGGLQSTGLKRLSMHARARTHTHTHIHTHTNHTHR